MSTMRPSRRPPRPALPGAGRGEAAGVLPRGGYTLVELLVSVSIILVLLALLGGAISAARNGAQAGATTNAISKLDQVILTQFRRYESRSVPRDVVNSLRQTIANPSAARAWHIRRNMIAADMPDRWSDVAVMASGTSSFPRTGAQAAYIATYNAANPKPTAQYGGAECLFMIAMQGGFADCLDCNGLGQLKKGDKDADGALEFWDEWNNPIDYILWAPGYRKPGETTPFFAPLDSAFPTTGAVRPGLGMRPLIYSAGPDEQYGLERNGDAGTLSRGSSPMGRDCGNPGDATTSTSGGPSGTSGDDDRTDNIVNLDLSASP
jgi:prepilin-type N-terminal cleavage/methylation domain-containing protein